MAEKRNNKRVFFRNVVRFGSGRPLEFTSMGKDLSSTGLGMETYWAFEPGTTIYMLIDANGVRYGAKGTVVWSNRVSPGVVQPETTGVGIQFTRVDSELMDIYRQKAGVA